MKQEQQQQAQQLYFQTDLSKSEIASMLGISRRTLHYWVRDYNWDRIKKSAQHIPSQLAENCYFIMAKMQEDILSETHNGKAPTYQEVNALYKLTLTINKLKARNTLNETLELGAHFMEFVNNQSPEAADIIKPYIDGYIASRAAGQPKQSTTARTTGPVPAPTAESASEETQLDLEDILYWSENPATATDSTQAQNVNASDFQHLENKTTTANTFMNVPLSAAPQKPTINLPKNEKTLNRAQRRQLARSKAAA